MLCCAVCRYSLPKLVKDTDGFSFAYISFSMMQWIADGGSGSLDKVMLSRVLVLRAQMNTADNKKKKSKKATA